MLDVKVKNPQEVLLERKLRSPFGSYSAGDSGQKYQFFKDKVKDFISYHLDYAKYNKKIISEDALEEIQRFDEEEAPPRYVKNKRDRYKEPEKNSEFKDIRDGLLNKVSALEKISSLIKSAKRIFESLDKIDSKDLALSKISNSNQIFNSIQDIILKELDNFHITLSLLDTYNSKQAFESAQIKKSLQTEHQNEINALKEKFEMKLKALAQHNKALSSNKHNTKLQEQLKERIEYLESMLSKSNSQISDKSEQLKQKFSETSYLNQTIAKQNEEISNLNKKINDLECLITVQQESYHGQIYDLTSEIARIKNMSGETELSHQMGISQYKYIADSAKNRLDQVLLELNDCEAHLDYVKAQSKEREDFLSSENLELREEIERLNRIVVSLKGELDQMHQPMEVEGLRKSYRQKDEEVRYLNDVITKLETESNQLLDRNKELFAYNQQLESKISKSRESRSLKSSKSEKKIKKK